MKPNKNYTSACGSILAKQDIKDAIDYVVNNENVDFKNIFLLGLSGGGHMAVLMSGFCSEYFKAVGAYVPIMDLKKWSEQNPSYREHILACCENSDEEMMARSPVSYIDLIAKSNIKIFHGKFDKVVPVSQSIEFYNQIMKKHPTSRVFLDVFDGGHEIDMEIAMYWILSQYKEGNRIKVTG